MGTSSAWNAATCFPGSGQWTRYASRNLAFASMTTKRCQVSRRLHCSFSRIQFSFPRIHFSFSRSVYRIFGPPTMGEVTRRRACPTIGEEKKELLRSYPHFNSAIVFLHCAWIASVPSCITFGQTFCLAGRAAPPRRTAICKFCRLARLRGLQLQRPC